MTSRNAFYEGAKVRLRPLQAKDYLVSVHWRNDPAIRDNILGYRFAVTEEAEAGWIDRAMKDQSGSRMVIAIEDKADDALVGYAYLNDIDWINRTAEFGILIGDKKRHGKGLGREALSLIVAHAFNVFDLRRIFLRVASYNEPALKLYRAFGFVEEGRLRSHIFLGSKYHDLIIMGLLRDDLG